MRHFIGPRYVLWAVLAAFPGGCGILSQGLGSPPKAETPPVADGGYLKAGPVTGVERGPAQRSLLKEYVDTKNKLKELQDKLAKLQEKLRAAQDALEECRRERDQEKAAKVAAQAERDKALQELRDKEVQLLNLALEKTKVEQELVKTQIQALAPGGGGSAEGGSFQGGGRP